MITLSDAAANALLTNLNDLLNAGSGPATIKLYTGTKPTKPDTAITTQTLLGTLTCSDPAGSVSARTLTFAAITQDSSADATGTATWARLADSAGLAVVDVDVSVTGGGAFLQMNTTSIVSGGPILINSMSITL